VVLAAELSEMVDGFLGHHQSLFDLTNAVGVKFLGSQEILPQRQ
jgi:hypothetical protein